MLALAFAPLWALADPSVAVAPPASAQASAGVLQSGYYLEHGNCCSGVTLDGSHVFIDVFTITPVSDCLIFATLVYDPTQSRQLEVGVVRCAAGVSVDGTCSTGQQFIRFVEINVGSGYTCYPNVGVGLYENHEFRVQRGSGTSTTWNSYFEGTNHYQALLGVDLNVQTYVWAEETGTGSCGPWAGEAQFSNWTYFNNVNGSQPVRSAFAYSSGGCWTRGAYSYPDGFLAYH